MSNGAGAYTEKRSNNVNLKPQGRFKRWLSRWMNNTSSRSDIDSYNSIEINESRPSTELLLYKTNHIKFNVHFASGGKVVEVTPSSGRSGAAGLIKEEQTHLYLISDEKNFGEEIEKIITMTGLR